jgi:hypothetical protein
MTLCYTGEYPWRQQDAQNIQQKTVTSSLMNWKITPPVFSPKHVTRYKRAARRSGGEGEVNGSASSGGRLQEAPKQLFFKTKMSSSLFRDVKEITFSLGYQRVGETYWSEINL